MPPRMPSSEASGSRMSETTDFATNREFCPPETEGILVGALATGPEAEVIEVVERKTHGEPVLTPFGVLLHETVRFTDGTVRLHTLGIPDANILGAENINPNPVSSEDALFTGPDGINRLVIDGLVSRGFHVSWLHHHGRHAVLPTSRAHIQTMARFLANKDIGRSADHSHAVLDHIAPNADFEVSGVYRKGYSRSDMSGEAFEAKAADHDRRVILSDLTAGCFAHDASTIELIETALKQIPDEAWGLGKIGAKLLRRAIAKRDVDEIVMYLGTFDLHPLNVIHELAWIRPLIHGAAGSWGREVPRDARGIRTLLAKDRMSHHADWKDDIHADKPGIHFLHRQGAHVSGADPDFIESELDRFGEIQIYRQAHSGDISDLQATDLLPADGYADAA